MYKTYMNFTHKKWSKVCTEVSTHFGISWIQAVLEYFMNKINASGGMLKPRYRMLQLKV